MKTSTIYKRITLSLAACSSAGFLLVVTPLQAQNTTSGRNSGQTQASQSDNRGQNQDRNRVRVTRASNYLGADVIASDGRKVGDVVDYFFNLGSAPHLRYVVIMTGGFLDLGGDVRAVPVSAISVNGDNCRLALNSEQFYDVPVLPNDRQRFLSDAQNRQRIEQFFNQSNRTANYNAETSGNENPNRAGAPTGQTSSSDARLISYSELRNANAYSQNGNHLGYFADAWLSLDSGRAPYIEITPMFQPFRTNFDRRYAVPTAKLSRGDDGYGYKLNVTTDELDQAQPVSETEGVKMLQDGTVGNTVLRVTVASR